MCLAARSDHFAASGEAHGLMVAEPGKNWEAIPHWAARATADADRGKVLRPNLVPLVRLERTTRGLGNRCSIHLSYRGMILE